MRTQAAILNNRRKAAIMLMVLGPELSGKVLRYLDDDHVEQLTLEVARLDRVTPEMRNRVIEEFHEMAITQDYIAEGGVEHAKKLLQTAFDEERASQLIHRVSQTLERTPFEFLRRSDPSQLITILQDEHPQTIALVLSYLPVQLAAQLLSKLPADTRIEVAERIALMDRTPPDVIRKVEEILERKVSGFAQADMASVGGVKALVDVLNHVDRQTERKIIESLQETNPELATEVMNMLFVFEDIVTLDDKAVQQVLREVEMKDLATALKGTSEEVQRKIFSNLSERAATMLQEDMEFMGPVKMSIVEEAQQKIVAVIRRLEEQGDISLGRGEDEVVV
ncbi:MAG: flagellar motor switch protein FliG [Armatimonadetes bacterium]|nr:MAG: flagellar motor switch protein FliG [Armatimonadota bacterium]GIV01813.1 MAG: flagellar motor switch protein FliG [Fimbriimonadales bacterium]